MPSLIWFGKATALLVSVQTMASLCLPSVRDICMLTVTLWKTMQSTSFTLSTGMFANFVKLTHELNCENICMNKAGLIISRLLEELSLTTTFLKDVYLYLFRRYMFRPLLAIFRRNTQLFSESYFEMQGY
jgi:hypothetical protein